VKPLHSEYRFFSFNCSNQMLHFIDVARPGLNLHRRQAVYVIPKDAVNTVVDAGLVTGTAFVASDRTRRRLARTGAPAPVSPLYGQESGRLSLFAGARESLPYVEAGFRAASQDRFDPPSVWPAGAELSVLDMQLRRYDQGPTELQRVDIFSARSADPRDAEASPWSWRFATGFTGRRLMPADNAVGAPAGPSSGASADASDADRYRASLEASDWVNPFYLRTAIGPAWGSPEAVFFTLVGGEWQSSPRLERGQQAYAVLEQGVTFRGEAWQATLVWQLLQPTWAGSLPAEGSVELALTRSLDAATAVSLSANRDRDVLGYQGSVQVGLARYF
jgi:hypothetical protein